MMSCETLPQCPYTSSHREHEGTLCALRLRCQRAHSSKEEVHEHCRLAVGECQESRVVALVDGSKKLSGMGKAGGRLADSMKPTVGRQPTDKGVEAAARCAADAGVVPLAAVHLHGCVHHDLCIYRHRFFLYYCDEVDFFSVH